MLCKISIVSVVLSLGFSDVKEQFSIKRHSSYSISDYILVAVNDVFVLKYVAALRVFGLSSQLKTK